VDLKEELANTNINITCIDRNGNIVKRITTEGGEVEDGEEGTSQGTTPQGEGGQNQGGTTPTTPDTPGDDNGGGNDGSTTDQN
jgi:hypothetical protein